MASLLFSTLALCGAGLLAHLLALQISLWAMRFGERRGIVSEVTDRSSHVRPTSRLGGIGLAAGFFIPYLLFLAALWFLPRTPIGWGANFHLLFWLMLGALGMFAVGLADDLWDLPPLFKLGGQLLASLALIPADLRFLDLKFVPIPGLPHSALMMGFAILWTLFFANAFNFMDGMDGFAARFARLSCLWLFIIAAIKASLGGSIFLFRGELFLLPIVGMACGGFFRVNRPPARVFMGDGGSLMLGYLLAVQAMLGDGEYYMASPAWPTEGPSVPAGAVWILLLPFIFDVLLTLLRRAERGENLLRPHRSHLYQRLLACGFSHQEVLRLNLRYFHACGAVAAGFALWPSAWGRTLLGLAAFGAMLHYWRRVKSAEAKMEHEQKTKIDDLPACKTAGIETK